MDEFYKVCEHDYKAKGSVVVDRNTQTDKLIFGAIIQCTKCKDIDFEQT